MRQEASKQARDSVVLTRDGGDLFAGFLDASPPDASPDEDYETLIADIKWYARVPQSGTAAAAAQSSKLLGCPIFRKQFYDDPRGNFWPVNKLAPCKSNKCQAVYDLPCGHFVLNCMFVCMQACFVPCKYKCLDIHRRFVVLKQTAVLSHFFFFQCMTCQWSYMQFIVRIHMAMQSVHMHVVALKYDIDMCAQQRSDILKSDLFHNLA